MWPKNIQISILWLFIFVICLYSFIDVMNINIFNIPTFDFFEPLYYYSINLCSHILCFLYFNFLLHNLYMFSYSFTKFLIWMLINLQHMNFLIIILKTIFPAKYWKAVSKISNSSIYNSSNLSNFSPIHGFLISSIVYSEVCFLTSKHIGISSSHVLTDAYLLLNNSNNNPCGSRHIRHMEVNWPKFKFRTLTLDLISHLLHSPWASKC